MKKLILTIICGLMILQFTARQKNEIIFKKTNWLKLGSETKFAKQSAKQLVQNKHQLNLQKEDELNLLKTTTYQFGYKHYRYQQTYRNFPVEGANFIIHEKNEKVELANGKLVEQLNVDTKAAISESAALQFALEYMNATLYAWNAPAYEMMLQQVERDPSKSFYPCGKLVIVDPAFQQEAANYRLAYKFDIYSVEPLSRKLVYVDAQNGNIVTTIEQIKKSDAIASGTSNYSGDIDFTADFTDGVFTLKQNNPVIIQVFSANNTTAYPQTPITSETNFFSSDPTANEVYWATEYAYNYFKDSLKRNSLDNNNMPLFSWVHYGENLNNAFWNGNWMTYGDGDNKLFSPLTTIDVIAHEITHGIIDYEANLAYWGESGALNESFSDIFGEVIEAYAKGTNDWILGADFMLQTGKNGLRNLSNPNDPNMRSQQPDTYQGNYWHNINSVCGSLNDFCGVHTNSGVQNYWFYLLSQGGSGTNDHGKDYEVKGIGIYKSAAIAYRNLTVYLIENSQFEDAREGAIQAAKDLFGEDSFEAEQTKLAWCAVGVGDDCTNVPCDPIKDKNALIALYNSTNGANWTNTWDLNQPMDTWYRVDLDSKGCVKGLGLYNNNLVGTIPDEIGDLSRLEYLELHSNLLLSGTIPSTIGSLSSLTKLYLSDNSHSGSIPNEIGNLISLQYISIKNNELTGSIPSEIGNLLNLIDLSLQNNSLSGSIPPQLGNLVNLEDLRLNSNQLSGSIPNEIGNLISLKNLNLRDNKLTGSIPPTIGNLQNLESLTIRNNEEFSGTIPVELYTLTNLTSLGLTTTQISGSLSPLIGNLVNLESLNLYGNNFTGSIPAEIGDLNNLIYLSIGGNELSGCYHENLLKLCDQFEPGSLHMNGNNFEVSWEDFCASGPSICPPFICSRETDSLALRIFYFATDGPNWTIPWDLMQPMDTWYGIRLENGRVTGIDLKGLVNFSWDTNEQGNNLHGIIPPEIGNLCELTYLSLNDNNLSGNIPPEIGNLYNLEGLGLLRNKLSGSIPSEIGNLLKLTGMELGDNNLTGSIPPEIGNLTQLTFLVLYYNQLSGSIPPEIGNLTNLGFILGLGHNQLSGSIPPELGNLIKLNRLGLNNNQLSGAIPPELCNLTNLLVFGIANNNLSGCYDSCMQDFICGQLALHSWFDGNININDGNDFDASVEEFCATGAGLCDTIPCNMDDWTALKALYVSTEGDNWLNREGWDVMIANFDSPPTDCNLGDLYGVTLDENGRVSCIDLDGDANCNYISDEGNNLNGPIPSEISLLKSLTTLRLSDNALGESIPPEIGDLLNLTKLTLVRCGLIGTIPPELGKLQNLIGLSLGGNDLTGNIPPELGKLVNLERLTLYFNKLNGSIPPELGNMLSLTELGLNNNCLTGMIPPELSKLINLASLNLSYNKLSGTIPSELGQLPNLTRLWLNDNQLSGNIPTEFKYLVNLATLTLSNNNLSGCYEPELKELLCVILSQSEYFNGNEDVSDGNNFDITWEEFCINDMSCESASPVYPGDFNNDGIVNMTDLLYWALAIGKTGAVRQDKSLNWAPQNCLDWQHEVNGVNGKHQDGDGNGVVDFADLKAFDENYGKRHAAKIVSITGSPVQFRLKQVSSNRAANGTVIDTFDLYVENDLGEPLKAIGLSCSIFFGDLPIKSINVDFTNSSLQPGEHRFKYSKDKKVLDIGLTRTDNINVPVDGMVARIIAIADEFDPIEPVFVRIVGGNAMFKNGDLSSVDGSGVFIVPFYEGINLETTFPLTVSTADEHYSRKGSAEAIPLGGQPPYTYKWSATDSTGSKINELEAGEYSVTVTDALNASATITFQIFKFGYDMVKCSAVKEVCSPDSPPPPLNLEDFEIINEAHFTGSLSLEIDTLLDVEENYTSTTYVYTIYDETGMQQTCQTAHYTVDGPLDAQKDSYLSIICDNFPGIFPIPCCDDLFTMYPNPTIDRKLLVIPKLTNPQYSIRIFDLNGNVLIQKQFIGKEAELNLSAFKNGMYMVELRSAEYQGIQKLVVK